MAIVDDKATAGMKYVEVFQSYGFIPFSTLNRGVFSQPFWGERQSHEVGLSGMYLLPHSTAGASVLLCSQRYADSPVPQSRGTLLHRQMIGKVLCTLCSVQVLSNAINALSVSQGVASTSHAHWKHRMHRLQVLSPAPPCLWPWVLPYWQIGTSHCHLSPRVESSSALGLKILHFRLQQEQERHTKYKNRGWET